jgi:hypothetical protein
MGEKQQFAQDTFGVGQASEKLQRALDGNL